MFPNPKLEHCLRLVIFLVTVVSAFAGVDILKDMQKFVCEIFNEKRFRNKSYSLRAFARDWGIQPGRVSEIMSGKRTLTFRLASLLAQNINLSQKQLDELSVLIQNQNRLKTLNLPLKKLIDFEKFKHINTWRHYALMALIESFPDVADDEDGRIFFSEKLGVSLNQLEEMIKSLKSIGILTIENKKYILGSFSTTTEQDKMNLAAQSFHRDLALYHLKVMSEVDLDLREVQSLIFTMSSTQLRRAKKKIRSFLIDLEKLGSKSKNPEVFGISIFLSPLTKINNSKK